MRLYVCVCVFALASTAFAQGDRGTITGTVADPAGAVVANAPIEARNIDTGGVYPVASTTTGNYTLSELPTGTYELSVSVPGFKKYVRKSIVVGATQVLRVDVALEIGAATESVTITEAVALLKTESGELSHNVSAQRLDELPVLGVGSSAGSAGIRNPQAATLLIPGTSYTGNALVRVNGAQGNTFGFRIEGGDVSNGYLSGLNQQTQPSVDAIQEISIQTSNFAAEFGQVGGGLFNVTMKSGSNQFHGSAYDYFVNEALNAGQPFTSSPKGLLRPVQRRNDYGFTVGGPVWIPKIYNGHDKTFFFFNLEQFRENQTINNLAITVPTALYRTGNFNQALTGRALGTDPLGRPIMEGTIYDPDTQRAGPNGQIVRDPFPNNTIPLTRQDPVSLKIQALVPLPTLAGVLNNGIYPFNADRVTSIPAIKIDHSLSVKAKLAFYWSKTSTEAALATGNANADGLPLIITQGRGTYVYAPTVRLNFDYVLSPTLLLHFGGGYLGNDFHSTAQVNNVNGPQQLGLTGAPLAVGQFPTITGLCNTTGGFSCTGLGGLKPLGPGSVNNPYIDKPTANSTVTWVRANHTYKLGAEMRLEGYIGRIYSNDTGALSFGPNQTGLPYLQTSTIAGGTIGFPYASFLLGAADTVNATDPIDFRLGKQQWGAFIQDSWKVTRKFTLDYGLRYDYSTYLREEYGRLSNFSPVTPNPSAGGLLGATIYEGNLPGRCNCSFAKNYPFAVAPRLGAAWQINSKTVLRAGWGIVYNGTEDGNGAANTLPVTNPVASPNFGDSVMLLKNGIPLGPNFYRWPNFNPGQYPQAGTITSPPFAIDQNAGRPARQNQWSIGLQRELARNLVVEAAYVGNRGVWWLSPGLIDVNALTPQRLAAAGLNINNATDRTLLTSTLSSATASARGFNNPPYPGFPLGSTVAQALRPFPQFGTIPYSWSPLGKTWYDSLQVKATKRYSYGLDFTSVFTWSKQFTLGSANSPLAGTSAPTGAAAGAYNDVFNRQLNKTISLYDQPFAFNTSVNYTLPTLHTNKVLSWAVRDWTIGAFLAYASGLPIQVPGAQNNLSSLLFRSTTADRVPGVPLFTQDLNCHCFDPNQTFALNPKAWTDPPPGQWGTAAGYYSDYRQQRRPTENFTFGRTFRIRERVSLSIRAEFTNVFNRTEMNTPTSTNALATQTTTSTGKTVSGFGYINTSSVAFPPRQGTIVARIQF